MGVATWRTRPVSGSRIGTARFAMPLAVVHELMRRREVQTRSWCLDIYEGDDVDSPISEIPFASVDPSLDHLTPKLRTMVESISERKRLLGDVIHSAKGTIQESRALVARARGKPYLASRFGKPIIRDV